MNNTDPNQTRNLSRAKNHPSFGKIMLASAVVLWCFDELAQMLVRALFTIF